MHGIRDLHTRRGKGRGVRRWLWSRMTGWRAAHTAMLVASMDGPHASAKGLHHRFGVAAASIPFNLIQKWLGLPFRPGGPVQRHTFAFAGLDRLGILVGCPLGCTTNLPVGVLLQVRELLDELAPLDRHGLRLGQARSQRSNLPLCTARSRSLDVDTMTRPKGRQRLPHLPEGGTSREGKHVRARRAYSSRCDRPV